MLRLKEYQERALQALKSYFINCIRLSNADTAYYETTKEWMGTGIPYRPVKELPGLPYVCLRIPTGGGKTLMACHAAGIALRDFLHAERCVVLWLVPSNTIREQTLEALRNRRHPYRLALESGVGIAEILDIQDALYVQRATLDAQTVVIVSTMQAFRVGDTEGRKVYEEAGALMGHFSEVPRHLLTGTDKREDGSVIPSLANVLRLRRPVVIVDEAHNARTDLSFETIARFAPSCIMEFTATPDTERNPSNVLYSVSAAELKAEAMIKMPIRLETKSDWKELLADAVASRARLESIAKEEQRETGEYLRPIMLLQAQPKRQNEQTLSVEVIEKCLLEDFKIPKEQVARATGTDRELEGVNPLEPSCDIRFIITVQALREGWDCPFAYVLCSVAEMHSSRAVEQILGRILRLPRAAWKKHDELNLAYAFAASPNFAQTAMALTDALIQNGFKRQEASDFIVPASSQQLEFPEGDLFSHSITVSIPEIPNVNALPDTIRQVVSFDPNSHTMTVIGEMTEMIKEQLGEYFSTSKGKEAIETAFWEFRKRAGKETERQRRIFSVPVLAIKVENLFEQLEENHLLERPLSLSKCDALLTEEEFPSKRPEGKMGEITVSKEGNLEVRFLSELTEQMWFFGASEGWTEGMLVQWLDRAIPHHDISQAESALFLVRATRALIDQRGFSLNQLVIDKYRLRHAVNEKIEKLRHEARGKAFQDLLFSEESSPLCVKPDVCFPYDPLHYPYGRAYRGGCQWRKHYYDQVGELEAQGEEFECAQFLDQLPQINSWVRNLERRPKTSFWLQTSTDKFYPDFVCLLNDGRYLAVEYKGEHLWSTDDSKEKRTIGDLWEKLSDGKCLFVMPKGKDFAAIRKSIGVRSTH